MTNWPHLTREEAEQLGIEGQYELMKIEEEEERKARKQPAKREYPTEYQEQVKLAEYLDYNNYCWCHVPNGGARHPAVGQKMKKQGVKAGVPDVLIFDVPYLNYNGVVIELKRQKGGKVRITQEKWLSKLKGRGWLTKVAYGADEAIEWLESIFEEVD